MIRGYKIRLYPDRKQQELITQHFGACRFIWNYMLDVQQNRHYNNESFLSVYDMNKYLTEIKKEKDLEWLKLVSANSLQRTCNDLFSAYQRFFTQKSRFPKYKRKKQNQSYPVCIKNTYFKDGCVNIEKVGKVKYKTRYELKEGRNIHIINPRIKLEHGKYILSFCLECESQARETTDSVIGIDLGVKNLATVSCGKEYYIFQNINYSVKMKNIERRIKYYQKSIGRKKKVANKLKTAQKSNNIKKEEEKLYCCLRKAANIRNNYTNQITHKIIEMRPKRIVMEDLCVTEMIKNRKFNRCVNNQTFKEFIRQMKYKSEWNNIEFVQADRFFPSSKMCSSCNHIKTILSINDRIYKCEICGLEIDRDINAAINLGKYAI